MKFLSVEKLRASLVENGALKVFQTAGHLQNTNLIFNASFCSWTACRLVANTVF